MTLNVQILLPRLCDTCLASLGKGTHECMSGRNFSLSATWRRTRLNHEGYLARETGDVSPFIQVEGFKIETAVCDWMHNIYLGCGRDLMASGLKLLISKNVWPHLGNDWTEILAGVHYEMHTTCASYGYLSQHYVCNFFFTPKNDSISLSIMGIQHIGVQQFPRFTCFDSRSCLASSTLTHHGRSMASFGSKVLLASQACSDSFCSAW